MARNALWWARWRRMPPRPGTVAIDYNDRVPNASGQPTWSSRWVKPLAVVAVLVGLNILGAYLDRQAISPTDDACTTMLDYFRAAPGGEDESDAWDRLRYVSGRLDHPTTPEAVAIREYLAFAGVVEAPGPGPNDLGVVDPFPIEVDGGTSPDVMRAAQACTDLGHPALEDYLNATRD
jgi:hypothetical protein